MSHSEEGDRAGRLDDSEYPRHASSFMPSLPVARSADLSGAPPKSEGCLVVGVGASAGGLEALMALFRHISPHSGMAFVVIQHLDPERPSMLASALQGSTQLQLSEASNDLAIESDCIYVIPSDADITLEGGRLKLAPRQRTGRLHLPIDGFFRSLAAERQDRAIGVVLSGSGADGTEGLRAIKAEGGIGLVQTPDSASARGMPESAISAGLADFRGTPEMLAGELERLRLFENAPHEPRLDQEKSLAVVFALLRSKAGVDFSTYKRTTVLRRLERRMALRQVTSLEEYAYALHHDPAEVRVLARDMLIHVTSFFRDPAAFAALQEQVFSDFVQRKGEERSIRIWVPGCSTGEEVYTLAICLLESLDASTESFSIKLFGTDLSEEAVATARIAIYSESALLSVSPERISKFFQRTDGGYQICKRIRDLCVFVRHDITRDPPFAKLDLISFRNVLIYFDAELQRRIVPMLHYCLNKHGYLFLGHSETNAGFRDLFAPVDKEHRIFVKTGESPGLVHSFPVSSEPETKLSEGALAVRRHPAREAQKQADHFLLARYAPPGVLVNDRLEIVQFRGRTGAYLEHPPGQPQANLLRMAREDLVVHLHDALERAKQHSTTVRKERVRMRSGSASRLVDLEVVPLALFPEATERYFLVLFDETKPAGTSGERHPERLVEPEPASEAIADSLRLTTELVATKDYIQTLLSEHRVTTDELAATNEEAIASNEELQSSNEELQSAKEELQSTNEELSTVNEQLRNRNQQLDQVASDLVNVLSSVEIPVIIVDLQLRVRRFTPAISDIASFIPEDVGRPIDDLKLRLQLDDLPRRIRAVIDGNAPMDWDVQGLHGRWYRMQVRPYRTVDQRLDGAVMSFVDVDVLKQARGEAESARDYAQSIVDTVTTALVVLDSALCVLSANATFHDKFVTSREPAVGKRLFDIGGERWDNADVTHRLEEFVAKRARFTALELTTDFPHIGRRILSLTGRPILWGGSNSMMLLAVDDVTDLRGLEAERAQLLASEKTARLEAERANQAKDLFLATLSHELRAPLSTMLMSAQFLKRLAADDGRVMRASAAIERATQAQARLIDDLLDVSRIVAGKLLLDLGSVDFADIVRNAIDVVRPTAQAKSLVLELEVEGPVGAVYGDGLRLQQVVNNLLTNAIKFTPRGGRVSMRLAYSGEWAQLSVKDTGMGIRPEVLPHLFGRFVQADNTVTRTHGGLGLGLSIVRHLVEAHGGNVKAESAGVGRGATFFVSLPLGTADVVNTVAMPQRISVCGIDGVRVLLVEDDDDTREASASMLKELGAEVWMASSAAAALAALEEFRPQVIVSDIAMPGEDGHSFIRQVRKLGEDQGGRVPAVALTALASNEDRQRALQAGFQVHVSKPIDSSRLAAIVGRLVAQT